MFWPAPVDDGVSDSIERLLNWLHVRGMPRWFNFGLIEKGANVLLFIPFGILVATYFAPRRTWLALPVGVAASSIIEVCQQLFLPERFPTVYDVLANSLGAAIGALIIYTWQKRHLSTAEH